MSLGLDLSTDYLLMDGLEPVDVIRSSVLVEVPHALRRGVTKKEADQSRGAYTTADTRWNIPAAECGRPKPADIIKADDGDYVILEVMDGALRNDWICTARLLRIESDLGELLAIEGGTPFQTRAGLAVTRDDTAFPATMGRVQPIDVDRQTEQQRDQSSPTHVVYLAEYLPLDTRHTIVSDSGRYQFVRYADVDKLDMLPMLEVRKV